MTLPAVVGACLLVAGCYAPTVRDCTVSCASPDDCAGGQVCGADGMCAAPGVAGRCPRFAPDAASAGPPGDGGAVIDARPDGPPTVRLTVLIMGKGSVALDSGATCSSLDPQKGNCSYDIAPGVPITAQALPIQLDQVFATWTSTTCAGDTARCTFTPTAATTISARFERAATHGAL